jgi:uncharacterized protein YjbJ (UPF0337 family)
VKDSIEGKLKEKEGELTGDKLREKQGEAEQAWDEAKGKVSEKKEQAKQEIRERL